MQFNLSTIAKDLLSLAIFKIATLAFLAFYVIFTFILLTQVNIMNQILTQTNAATTLKTIAIIYLALAISLFILSLVML